MQRGLDLQFGYVFAHGLDNSEAISNDGRDGFASAPSRVSTLEYGNSNLDIRSRVTGTFNYILPFGDSLRGFRSVLVRDGRQMDCSQEYRITTLRNEHCQPKLRSSIVPYHPRALSPPSWGLPQSRETGSPP